MTPPARAPYVRMNGIGNAILVADLRAGGAMDGARALRLGREPGLSFDQLMALHPPRVPGTDAFVDIFNADGSRAGACGNGTRCVAWALLRGSDRVDTAVETEAGVLPCRRDGPLVFTVDMGAPRLGWADIPLGRPVADTRAVRLDPVPGTGFDAAAGAALGPAALVSMGNPHAVFFLDPAAALPDLAALGPALEHHPQFPERANISFARVTDRASLRLDVWERGAGLTRACGSAACAVAVAAARTGRTGRQVAVDLPGGTLRIRWREADDHVLMTGPVEVEGEGLLPGPDA